MDKVTLANMDDCREYYGYTEAVSIGEQVIQVRTTLRRSEREALAMDISAATLVFDEKSGLVYEGYNRDVMRMMCILRSYTNLDTEPFDTADSRYLLYDMLKANGVLAQILDITRDDMKQVQAIFELLRDSAQRIFENTHTLPYQIQQAFSSVLTTENLSETLAKASTVNNKMVDMLGAFRRENAHTTVNGLNMSMREAK